MSFTDGPYELDGFGMVRDQQGRTLAQVGSLGDEPLDVDEAVSNGFLFAAAPDLYEALARVSRYRIPSGGNVDWVPVEVFRQVDIALSRARGEGA